MTTLIFNRLTIISDLTKTAAQFKFSKRYNLIISEGKNSVGKTSLVKNIFWCFGCEPRFDDAWLSLDSKVVVDFEVSGKPYSVARQGNRYVFYKNGEIHKKFVGLNDGFSEFFSKLVNFNAQLPVHGKDEISTPPPAYYFLPFYIDQKQSWSNAWVSFDKLTQFPDWKKVIIPYHTGMIKNDYFITTDDIYRKKREKTEVNEEIVRFDTAISVVNEFVPDVNAVVNEAEFEDIEDELKVDVMELHLEQETLYEKVATLRAEKSHLSAQLSIAEESLSEISADYEYAEAMDEEIECPTCGVVHDNSIVNRFTLLQDREQVEDVIRRLSDALGRVSEQIDENDENLKKVRSKISNLDDKYIRSDQERSVGLEDILNTVASNSVRKKVEGNRSLKVEILHNLDSEEKFLKKERTKNSAEDRKAVKSSFQDIFPSYLAKLKAFGVDASNIKSPENFGKVSKSGGAAESTRAMLAYYLTVYKLIEKYSEETLSPLVIDTPNQHEQAAKHYESIVKLIMEEMPSSSQIFICGMNSDKLNVLKEQAKVILLNVERSLLNSEDYERLHAEFSSIFGESDDDV